MFSSSRSLFFTLFLALTLLIALAPTADANGNTVPAHRRQANRMLRKRAPLPASTDPSGGGVLPIGVGQDPDKVTDTSTSTSTSATAVTSSAATGKSTTSTSTTSSAVTSGVTTTSTTLSTTSTSTLSTISDNSTSTSTTSTSTTSTSTSSIISTSSSSTSSSTQETLAVTSAPSDTAAVSRGPTTVTFTSSLSDSSPTATAAAASTSSASSSGIGKATLTVIIVIASCIGGAIIIWTIIRKWKFSPSAEFEERMQPIDWQPTAEHNRADDGIPGSLRRVTSNASHGSFHSGSDHDGRAYNGYSGASDQGHTNAIVDLPPHDFTPGPAHLAPVGGYADLARGPSPQPQMTEALGRGNTINRGNGYDTYGPRY